MLLLLEHVSDILFTSVGANSEASTFMQNSLQEFTTIVSAGLLAMSTVRLSMGAV